jgi:hypothetical protein
VVESLHSGVVGRELSPVVVGVVVELPCILRPQSPQVTSPLSM